MLLREKAESKIPQINAFVMLLAGGMQKKWKCNSSLLYTTRFDSLAVYSQ